MTAVGRPIAVMTGLIRPSMIPLDGVARSVLDPKALRRRWGLPDVESVHYIAVSEDRCGFTRCERCGS